jgi:MFS family permease
MLERWSTLILAWLRRISPAWLQQMNPGAKNALLAAFLCYAAAAMSMHILEFIFILETPHVPWFCSADPRSVADNIFSATLSASAIGGGFFGLLSDRFGRVHILRITVAWTAVFMFLSGGAWAVKWNYEPLQWLLFNPARFGTIEDCLPLGLTCIFMGFGFGGVWAAGAVLAGEWAGPVHRGKFAGLMQCGWAVGGIFAFVAQRLLHKVLGNQETVYLWMLWGALALALLAFFIRRPAVRDEPVYGPAPSPSVTNIFLETLRWTLWVVLAPLVLMLFLRRLLRAVADTDMTMDSLAVLRTTRSRIVHFFTNFHENVHALRTWALTVILSTGAMAGYYAITLQLSKFLKMGHPLAVDYFLICFITGSFFGYLAGGWVSDRFGRRVAFAASAAGSIVITVGLWMLPLGDLWVLLLTFVLGIFSSAVFSGMGAFFTELYPLPRRGLEAGSSYSCGRRLAYNLWIIQWFDGFIQWFANLWLIQWLVGIIQRFDHLGSAGWLKAHLSPGLSTFVFIVTAYAFVIIAARWLPAPGRELTPRTQ